MSTDLEVVGGVVGQTLEVVQVSVSRGRGADEAEGRADPLDAARREQPSTTRAQSTSRNAESRSVTQRGGGGGGGGWANGRLGRLTVQHERGPRRRCIECTPATSGAVLHTMVLYSTAAPTRPATHPFWNSLPCSSRRRNDDMVLCRIAATTAAAGSVLCWQTSVTRRHTSKRCGPGMSGSAPQAESLA